ncbi:hypothetical protein L596_012107 [Steinernema carpocapsae]|uniref:G-protein coupled receptors family 1 profile domain-containing protein n=1 Tax=Steinernema carpocapsae TaxID=34508 RepID=A0A4U5NWA6_STECR|nr:hypothetical protein L596_012107 [Steinernema carpocapsae]
MDFTENSRNATFSEEIDSLLYTTFVFDACSSFFNALIIYQSLFRVRTSVCRYYALNHACASFAYSFFRFILNLTNITTVGRYFLYKGPRIESDLNDVTRFIHVFLFRYASNSYRILGLLVMLLTYLSYANPELCSRLVTPRSTRLLFWGSHVPCLAMCLLVVPRLTEDIHNRRFFIDTIDKKTYAFLMEKGIGLFLLIALTALYILVTSRHLFPNTNLILVLIFHAKARANGWKHQLH